MNYKFPTLTEKQKHLIGGVLTIISAIGLFYLIYSDRELFSTQIKELEFATNDFLMQTLPLKNDVFTPPPLRDEEENQKSFLSNDGIFEITNQERVNANMEPLTRNSKLDLIAEKKLSDMFFYQYFEHISPLGVGAGELAQKNQYEYILIGENLAMGNFIDDQALVQAWMNSEGHRENILHDRYSEIGVAVGRGVYEGKLTWIAVQEFGLPLNNCITPSIAERDSIDNAKKEIETQEQILITAKTEIDSLENKYGKEYEEKVEAYNLLVRDYNALVVEVKSKVSKYNTLVLEFNNCTQGN